MTGNSLFDFLDLFPSSGWCTTLGIISFEIGETYPLITIWGEPQVGSISVKDSTAADDSYFLIIDVNIDEGYTLERTNLYVGTSDGFFNNFLDGCPNYTSWPYVVEEVSNNHTFVIPFDEIDD